jgi:hypothetical protein
MITWSWAYIRWASGFGLINRVWQIGSQKGEVERSQRSVSCGEEQLTQGIQWWPLIWGERGKGGEGVPVWGQPRGSGVGERQGASGVRACLVGGGKARAWRRRVTQHRSSGAARAWRRARWVGPKKQCLFLINSKIQTNGIRYNQKGSFWNLKIFK